LIGGLAEQADPALSLRLRYVFAYVLGEHARIAAVLLTIVLWPVKNLAEPCGHALGVIRRHFGKQRAQQRLLATVFGIAELGHARQGRQPPDPPEQRRLVLGVDLWIVEIDIPVHTATERFVLGVTAATQTVVFQGGPSVARFIIASPI